MSSIRFLDKGKAEIIEDLISKIENDDKFKFNLNLESDITEIMSDLVDEQLNELIVRGFFDDNKRPDQETIDKAEKTLSEKEKAELKRRSEEIIAQKKETLHNIESLEKLVESSTGKQSVVLDRAKFTLESAEEKKPKLKKEIEKLENFDEYLKNIKDAQKTALMVGENKKNPLTIFKHTGKLWKEIKQPPKARITKNAALRAGKKERPKARITKNAALRAIYVSSDDDDDDSKARITKTAAIYVSSDDE